MHIARGHCQETLPGDAARGHCQGTLPMASSPAAAPSAHAALHRSVWPRPCRFCSISTLPELRDAKRAVSIPDGTGQSSLQSYHGSGFQSRSGI